jgi:hypothetical protein
MSENIVNKSNDENVERKLTVKEFCRRYDMLKTDEQKSNFVQSMVYRTYCPVLEKKVILQTMLDKTIVSDKNGVEYIDMFLSKINFTTTILLLYTKFNISKNDDSETTAFQDYDLLIERGFLNVISAAIGEDELNELTTINGLLMDNFYAKNKNLEAFIAKYTQAFATIFGMFADEGISELMKYIKEYGDVLGK